MRFGEAPLGAQLTFSRNGSQAQGLELQCSVREHGGLEEAPPPMQRDMLREVEREREREREREWQRPAPGASEESDYVCFTQRSGVSQGFFQSSVCSREEPPRASVYASPVRRQAWQEYQLPPPCESPASRERSSSVLSVRIKSIYNEYIAARDKSRRAKQAGGGGGGAPPRSPKPARRPAPKQHSFSSPSAKLGCSTAHSGQTTDRRSHHPVSGPGPGPAPSATGAITGYAQWSRLAQARRREEESLAAPATRKKPPLPRREVTLSPKALGRQTRPSHAHPYGGGRQASLSRAGGGGAHGGGHGGGHGGAPNYLFRNLQHMNSAMRASEDPARAFRLSLAAAQEAALLPSGRASSRERVARRPTVTVQEKLRELRARVRGCGGGGGGGAWERGL